MDIEKFKKHIDFLVEIDKVKSIFRQTKLYDRSREENDAEHAWSLSLMALVLTEYANEKVDILKVIKMVLIHDIVEIDTGDTLVYHVDQDKKIAEETKAARRIFGLLPEQQKNEYYDIWQEFEKRETPEAKFATALDRLAPIMQNYYTKGAAWKKHNIDYDRVVSVNKHIAEGSQTLWDYAVSLLDQSLEKGYLKKIQ